MSENIWVAAADNQIATVKSLIDSGKFSPNSADPNGFTPIHAAASYGNIELLRYLLQNGGNVNIQDKDGDTPLHHAESVDIARILIGEFGADYKIKNNEGLDAKEFHIQDGEFPELIQFLNSLDQDGENNVNISGGLTLPNGEVVKAFLNNNEEETPEMVERRKQVEAIFANSELSEEQRDEELRNYVSGVVLENMGKLREEESDHKRKR
ncbi:hypothetical protein CANINC_001455 [Pichia inconspicua]|uniref:Uncharacterized protein n=1 Tax=Pichia inconspicua TaxID=52247 RepID=A0A4T0X581_9ASCO|nr:hypothetical protein CANINC_001455 [[Candida] inconspicua]